MPREACEYHREIAEIIGVSKTACQQLLPRARKHLGAQPRFAPDRGQWHRIAEAFCPATQAGA